MSKCAYCPTSFNYADIMTKALTPAKFAELYAMCVESKSLQFANRPISSDEGGRARDENSSRIVSLSIYRWMIARSEFTDSRSSFTASQVGGVSEPKGSKVPSTVTNQETCET